MKKHMPISPEKAFLFLAITFGILLVFITPPFQTPDENDHFYHAFQIAEMKFKAEKNENKVGGLLPTSLKKTVETTMDDIAFHPEKKITIKNIFAALKIPLNVKDREFIEFTTVTYSPVVYIPQSMGIFIGKTLKFSPLILMYIGRSFNLFFWIIIIYLTIKITPILKWTFYLLAIMPMSIFLSSSLSADTITNALCFLFISFVFSCAFQKEGKITNNDIFIILLLSILISLTKHVYFITSAIFLIIPYEKVDNRKKYNIIFLSLIVLSASVFIGWYLITKELLPPLLKSDVFPNEQIAFIVKHPIKFLLISIKTLSSKKFLSHFVGQLGWLDTQMSWLFITSYILILWLSSFVGKVENFTVSKYQKVISSK